MLVSDAEIFCPGSTARFFPTLETRISPIDLPVAALIFAF
jgi:hypothetical protein